MYVKLAKIIEEALSGASRAYRKALKNYDKYSSKAASLHDEESRKKHNKKRRAQLNKINKIKSMIPRSKEREDYRAAEFDKKFEKF